MRFKCNLPDMNTHKTLERRGFGDNRLSLTFQSSLCLIPAVKLVAVWSEQALFKKIEISYLFLFSTCIENHFFTCKK